MNIEKPVQSGSCVLARSPERNDPLTQSPADRSAKSQEHRHLGDAVRELRERHGLSQAELAERAGLRRHHLAAIERGEVDPTFLTLVRLTRAVPAPLADLMRIFEERRHTDG